MEGDEKLPQGWVRVKSRTRPNKEYFYNQKLKVSLWNIEDIKNINSTCIRNENKKTPVKSPRKAVSSLTKNSETGTSIQSKNIFKKNVARDRLSKLQKVLQEEAKRNTQISKNIENVQSSTKKNVTINQGSRSSNSALLPQLNYAKNKAEKKNIAKERMKRLNKSLHGIESGNEHCNNNNASPLQDLKFQEKDSSTVIKTTDSMLEEAQTDVEMKDVSFELTQKKSNHNKSQEKQIQELEEMEWESVPELEVISKVQKIRSAASDSITSTISSRGNIKPSNNQFIIVVDTNILLSNIDFLKDIKGKMFKGEHELKKGSLSSTLFLSRNIDIGKATIYLPYIVLVELDKLKSHGDNVSRLARRAITFIDECFNMKDRFFIGQSGIEKQIIPAVCGDDRILNCCLQLIEENTKKLILLTNDKNLRNKAFVNKIEAFSRDMLFFIDYNLKNDIKFELD